MTDFVRGNTLVISGTFKPKPGQSGTPSSATATLVYTNMSGQQATDTVACSLGTDGVTWSGTWDSTRCKGGLVSWSIRSGGGLVGATQGSFEIDANIANVN